MPTSLSVGGYRVNGNLNEGVGDAGVGTAKAGTFPTVEGSLGSLGVNVFFSTAELAGMVNPAGTIGTLYGGWFKYVKFKATWSASLAAGQILQYATVADMLLNIVTADVAAAGIFAGYALSAGITKGNHWWIQQSGIVTALCQASVTTTTAGDIAINTAGGTAGTLDSIADATDYYTTALKGGKNFRGQWLDAPANSGLKRLLAPSVAMFQ